MVSEHIVAATKVLNNEEGALIEYEKGISELEYFLEFNDSYEKVKAVIHTKFHGEPFLVPNLKPDRRTDRTFTRYAIYTFAIIEYLSTENLVKIFGPSSEERTLRSHFESQNQYSREKLLKKFDVFTGSQEDSINRVRGVRNDVAHGMGDAYNISQYNHPLEFVSDSRDIVDTLTKEVYSSSVDEIILFLEDAFASSKSSNTDEWSTIQLLDRYHSILRGIGGKYNLSEIAEKLEKEEMDSIPGDLEKRCSDLEMIEKAFESRGYDSNRITEVERTWKDGYEKQINQADIGSSPIVIKSKRIPSAGDIGEKLEFNIEASYDRDWNFSSLDFNIEELEWYGLLIVDEDVVDVRPCNSLAIPEPISAEKDLSVELKHVFEEKGEYEIRIGVRIDSDDQILAVPVLIDKIEIKSKKVVELGDLEFNSS